MKRLAFVILAATTSAHAGQFSTTCSGLSSNISNSVNRSENAASRLISDVRSLERLVYALERAAQTAGSPNTINLNSQLDSSVGDTESSIRSSASLYNSALSVLRRTITDPSLGSQVRPMAGQAADTLGQAKSAMTGAGDRLANLKSRISQVNQQLHQNGQLAQALQAVRNELSNAQTVGGDIQQLNELNRIFNDVRSYTSSCSNTVDINCTTIRSNLSRAGDALYQDDRDLKDADLDLRNGIRSTQQALQTAGQGGNLPDITSLISYIDSSILPQIQDSYNNLVNGESIARQASHEESGAGFDQLVRNGAIPSVEKADRLAQQGSSGLNSLRSQINSLQGQINNSSNPAAAQALRQASRDVAQAERHVDSAAARLGGARGGDLRILDDALDQHRRYCELPSF